MLLARLAVSTAWQGRGLGAGLLKDAMRRTIQGQIRCQEPISGTWMQESRFSVPDTFFQSQL